MYYDPQSTAFPILHTLVADGIKEYTPCYPEDMVSAWLYGLKTPLLQ